MIILELLPCQGLHCIVGIFKILSKKVFSEDSFVQKPGGVDRNVRTVRIVESDIFELCLVYRVPNPHCCVALYDGKAWGPFHHPEFLAQPPQRAHHMEVRC